MPQIQDKSLFTVILNGNTQQIGNIRKSEYLLDVIITYELRNSLCNQPRLL